MTRAIEVLGSLKEMLQVESEGITNLISPNYPADVRLRFSMPVYAGSPNFSADSVRSQTGAVRWMRITQQTFGELIILSNTGKCTQLPKH